MIAASEIMVSAVTHSDPACNRYSVKWFVDKITCKRIVTDSTASVNLKCGLKHSVTHYPSLLDHRYRAICCKACSYL